MAAIDYETMKQFAYHLFGQMTDAENPVISPVSAYLTLAVAGCGANGTTKDEFYNVLGQNMETLAGEIKKDFSIQGDYVNLSLANAAWFDTRFTISNKWFDTARHLADAEIFQAELFQKETMDAITVTELIAALCAVFDTKKLYFNEPFFYMIMDMEHVLPLFMGILDNPAE